MLQVSPKVLLTLKGISPALIMASCKNMKCLVASELSPSLFVFIYKCSNVQHPVSLVHFVAVAIYARTLLAHTYIQRHTPSAHLIRMAQVKRNGRKLGSQNVSPENIVKIMSFIVLYQKIWRWWFGAVAHLCPNAMTFCWEKLLAGTKKLAQTHWW